LGRGSEPGLTQQQCPLMPLARMGGIGFSAVYIPLSSSPDNLPIGGSPLRLRLRKWLGGRHGASEWLLCEGRLGGGSVGGHSGLLPSIFRTNGPLYSSFIRPSQQDSLLYTQFSRTHPSSISSSIHSIHYGTHLSLYLNISMCDLVLKDLLRRI
jgi:hypothetical protein